MAEMETSLEAIDVVKIYGEGSSKVLAVNEVSFAVRRGEFMALVGPSGSGKTSMLAMLAGLLHPTSGEIAIAGRNLTAMSEAERTRFRGRSIGFAFQANNLVRQYQDELRREGVPFDEAMEIGAMIEIPSAVLVANALAECASFFSLGTNDLIQYTLAVDRTDERLSDLYQPLHPAVLRLLRLVRRAATRQRIDASVCGEMASDPALIGLLIGLGFREFSMTPSALPVARRLIQEIREADARAIAGQVLGLPTAADIEQHLFDSLAASTRGRPER